MQIISLLALLAASVSAWGVAPGVVPLRRGAALRQLRASPLVAAEGDDEVTFSFGDAADMPLSTETASAVQEEEREMTEKEKEIARLRAAEKFMKKDTGDALCTACGYKFQMAEGVRDRAFPVQRNTPFDLLPESWACPNCKAPKAFFEPIQIEIAGFEDNQAFGIGTNTWTEEQKSTAIFGGLGAFFLLFMGGYALN